MKGAEAVVASLIASGVDVCFSNPGTSELHAVAAIDKRNDMRPVLCLFEGVATGAADGYGRMAEKPAATLLHLGPGLANGLANLHNARKALTPVVNIVGEHATYHRHLNAPLTADIEGFARPVSQWIKTSLTLDEVGTDAAAAVAAARAPHGGVATLILPADLAWSDGAREVPPVPVQSPAQVETARIEDAAAALKAAKQPAILLAGRALRPGPLAAAGRIAEATGARLYCEFFAPRLSRGAGIVPVTRLPYFAEAVVETLAGTDLLMLVETEPPVAFFAYPDKPSELTPEGAKLVTFAQRDEDGPAALEALAAHLGARTEAAVQSLVPTALPSGALTAQAAGQVIGALLPEGAIVIDESCTSGIGIVPLCQGAQPHDWLSVSGGALGFGVPGAVGAAVACPDRKVIALLGDGAAMYTVQGLWTAAREGLDIIALVFSNRSYAILNFELGRLGTGTPGERACSMLDLSHPDLDFVALAQGMGVQASRVDSAESFADAFKSALGARGPRLIDLALG